MILHERIVSGTAFMLLSLPNIPLKGNIPLFKRNCPIVIESMIWNNVWNI